jgi:hypothetical protein
LGGVRRSYAQLGNPSFCYQFSSFQEATIGFYILGYHYAAWTISKNSELGFSIFTYAWTSLGCLSVFAWLEATRLVRHWQSCGRGDTSVVLPATGLLEF